MMLLSLFAYIQSGHIMMYYTTIFPRHTCHYFHVQHMASTFVCHFGCFPIVCPSCTVNIPVIYIGRGAYKAMCFTSSSRVSYSGFVLFYEKPSTTDQVLDCFSIHYPFHTDHTFAKQSYCSSDLCQIQHADGQAYPSRQSFENRGRYAYHHRRSRSK